MTATVSPMPLPKVKVTYTSRQVWVACDQAEIEPSAQRKFQPSWAEKIAADFDPDLLGLPFVWSTTDANGIERFVVIDGWHRIQATRRAMGPGQRILCEVITGITLKRAAQLYRGRNKIRLPRPVDEFLSGVTAEDPECVAINRIIEAAGFHISRNPGQSNTMAVAGLRRVYRMAPDGSLLVATLAVIVTAWGTKDSLFGDVFVALAMVLRRYRDNIDHQVLIKKLHAEPGGAEDLIGRGRKLNNAVCRGMIQSIAHATVIIYNHGQQANKKRLTEWGARES